jgi:hypothetical protein
VTVVGGCGITIAATHSLPLTLEFMMEALKVSKPPLDAIETIGIYWQPPFLFRPPTVSDHDIRSGVLWVWQIGRQELETDDPLPPDGFKEH